MSKDRAAWSWVTINIAVWQEVPDDVFEDLRDWLGRKYSNTQRSSRATSWAFMERREGYTWLTFAIHKRNNPHHVGKRAEKKLSKLLADVN